MRFKKIIGKIHLWLGLASGLVVVFLGITGCILAFENEIRALTETYREVPVQSKPFLPPTVLKQVAENHLTSKKSLGVEYPGAGKAAVSAYYDENNYELVFLDPYTGAFLKHKNMNSDFFRVVLDGHFYLWLPPNIGQPIVASATLIFLVMLITGLILWWPKNKAARKQRFSIKWTAKWRRKNYDLHNVLGFYMTWVAIFIAITGLVWGFEWFSNSLYWATSGGKKMIEEKHPESDTTKMGAVANVTDLVWALHKNEVKADEGLSIYFAGDSLAPVEAFINHRPGTYYNMDAYHYDQYTGKEMPVAGVYAGKFKDAKVADKIRRMNYDIHVGAVLGLPGKIMAFFASLIAASLPITGFIIWWGRRKKAKAASPVIKPESDTDVEPVLSA
ncbi:MAG: PepSY-associated TM helix domain-containing protein [Ferruginibacter sp.]